MPDVRKNIDIVIRAQDETRRGVQSADAALASFNKTTLALGITAAGVAVGIRTLANDMDQLSKTARQLGTTTEQVQRLSYAARIMDIEFSALTNSVVELQRRLDDPKIGIALSRIGLRIQDLKDQDPATVLSKISDALAGVESQSIKAATAYELFGRQGREILSVMASGSKELNKLMAEAPVIPEETVKSIGEFGDQLDKLEMSAKASGVTILGPLMDGINALIAGMERLKKLGSGMAGAMPWAMPEAGQPDKQPRYVKRRIFDVSRMRWVEVTSPVSGAIQPDAPSLRPARPVPPDMVPVESPGLDMVSILASQGASAANELGLARKGGYSFGSVTRDFKMPDAAQIAPILKMEQELSAEVGMTRDQYDALRDGMREVEVQGESLGATLVDGAFQWADVWSRGMALVATKQAEFADMGKRLFRSMIADMLSWINRLIARQLVSAILNAIIGGGNPAGIAAAVSAASSASGIGSASAAGADVGPASRAFQAPRVATGDLGRNVTLNANISATFASRSEMQAAAVQLVRMAQTEFAR